MYFIIIQNITQHYSNDLIHKNNVYKKNVTKCYNVIKKL
jgi:hypothetical protein